MQATVTDHRQDVSVLSLRGELDVDTAATLHATLDELMARDVPRIVVDLAGLGFCDSTGLSAFLTSRNAALARGGWVRLAGPNRFVRQLLATVGLTRELPIYPDVAAATEDL